MCRYRARIEDEINEYRRSNKSVVRAPGDKQRLTVTIPEGHVDLSSSTSDEGILLSVAKESSTEELHCEREEAANKHDSEE